MLKINGNRLSAEGVQFTLPENFYIDAAGVESSDDNSIRFVSVKKDCVIDIRTDDDDFESAMASLLDSFSDFVLPSGSQLELFDDESNTSYQWIEKPEEFSVNGLQGAYTKYEAFGTEHYRIHLEKVNGFKKWFVISMTIKQENGDLQTILKRPEICSFFSSFELCK